MAGTPLLLYEGLERNHCEPPFVSLIEPPSSAMDEYSYFGKGFGKKCARENREGNMGYDQYTVPDTLAVEPTFAAFL